MFYDIGFPRRQPQGLGGDGELAGEVPGAGGLDLGLQLRLLGKQFVEVGIGIGKGGADLVETVEQGFQIADGLLDIAAHGLGIVELRFLRKIADTDAGLRPGLADELRVDARHDAQQGRFARTVKTDHADLGAREKRQRDVLENLTLGRDDFAYPIHRVYVLRHIQPIALSLPAWRARSARIAPIIERAAIITSPSRCTTVARGASGWTGHKCSTISILTGMQRRGRAVHRELIRAAQYRGSQTKPA